MSEEVLATAILAFYKQTHGPTLPLGIAEEVLIKWAGKMAFGLREMASRFKRLLWESPMKAKSKKIQEMKKLYWEMHAKYGKKMDEGPAKIAAHDAVEVVTQTGFDWVALEKRLEIALAKKKEEETQTKNPQASTKSKLGKRRQSFESTSSLASEELREGNPYLLPQYVVLSIDVRLALIFPLHNLIGIEVVTSLKGASCPAPVSVDPTETKNEGFELSDDEGEEKKKKNKKATKGQNGKRKPKTKKTEKQQVAAQEAPAGGEDKKEKSLVEAPSVVEPTGPVVYQAKSFQNAMREFVKDKRQAGMSYKDACEAWMRSDVRADMLSTLSIGEMKKRKFC